ncbi:uncharacterized protein LOC135949996 [Calliphora vicina]|uniref:uncharacterized protein LOC135949996 n=1 Tax=Calliphora vicina TaxID=7373 RepID=UPI00325B6B0D
MASNPYVKSLFWLLSIGGLGYGLMVLTAPSEEKLAKIRATTGGIHITQDEKNKVLFLKKLQEAANQKDPIYSKKPDN